MYDPRLQNYYHYVHIFENLMTWNAQLLLDYLYLRFCSQLLDLLYWWWSVKFIGSISYYRLIIRAWLFIYKLGSFITEILISASVAPSVDCLWVYYLRQVNKVNGGDNAFVRCVFVCQCVCLCVRSGRSWELNANSSKRVKATDFKFDTRVSRDSLDVIPKNFPKRVRGHGHVTP